MDADREAMQKALAALDEARRALRARLGGDATEERSWPPPHVDLRDAYWEWCTLQRAGAAGPHGETKLHRIRHHVSVKIDGRRWYSLRRIHSDYTAG